MPSVAAFVASLAICVLSFIEHGRSVKPSTLLTVYLTVSVLVDGVGLWSIYLDRVRFMTVLPQVAVLTLTFILLVVESWSKRSYLRKPYCDLPVERTAGEINRALLLWINSEIRRGNSKLLSVSDLPSLDLPLESREMRERMVAVWEKTCEFHE